MTIPLNSIDNHNWMEWVVPAFIVAGEGVSIDISFRNFVKSDSEDAQRSQRILNDSSNVVSFAASECVNPVPDRLKDSFRVPVVYDEIS
ncbi:MAG: hypothetical protein NPIRA04_06690 [Nitrospirales bacterium]|nr:MAG: hypothetical protein NPIRA04_06690 [Nitrospirales bacterium]